MKRFCSALAAAGLVAAGFLTSGASAADYGTFAGQVTVDGDPAAAVLKPKVKMSDPAVRDACCKEKDVPNDEVVVNKDNKGLANCFVWFKKVDAVHPDLKVPKEKTVVFDQKGCQFKPHCLIIRKEQQVVVKSDDPVPHNTHIYSPFEPQNVTVAANDRAGITFPNFKQKHRLPVEVKCDIHPWMRAWWLLVDHPYAAVTDADGKFKIENVPVGSYEAVIWHERTGYIEKSVAVKIAAGKVAEQNSKVPVAKLIADK